ncbi:hypothetical protein FRB95_009826 [Tulasnella sp. JGI-2019a]|nr:hypothetical protein FRB95_009826 [Tulasnella sp. JGI-2019a]
MRSPQQIAAALLAVIFLHHRLSFITSNLVTPSWPPASLGTIGLFKHSTVLVLLTLVSPINAHTGATATTNAGTNTLAVSASQLSTFTSHSLVMDVIPANTSTKPTVTTTVKVGSTEGASSSTTPLAPTRSTSWTSTVGIILGVVGVVTTIILSAMRLWKGGQGILYPRREHEKRIQTLEIELRTAEEGLLREVQSREATQQG